MRKLFKYMIANIFAMVLLLSSVTVFAGDTITVDENGYKGTLQQDADGTYSLTLTEMPSSGKLVINVGGNDYTNHISRVTLNGITSIQEIAFADWRSLNHIYAPDVVSVGKSALYNTAYENFYFHDSFPKLTKVPDYLFAPLSLSSDDTMTGIMKADLTGATEIGDAAFFNTYIEKVVNAGNITKIGTQAFEECTFFTGLDTYEKVESIGSMAFKNCQSLKSISNTPNLTNIGNQAFNEAFGLNAIVSLDSLNTVKIGSEAFSSSGIAEISTASSTTLNVGANAFEGCGTLSDVNIAYFSNIGASAFKGCSSLQSINIYGPVQSISNECFRDCTKLQNVEISNNINSVGNLAFKDTQIGDFDFTNIVSIGESAFAGITPYESGNGKISLTNTTIGVSAFEGCGFVKEISLAGISALPNKAFKDTDITVVVDKTNDLITVGDECFYDCYRLKTFTTTTAQNIGDRAFYGCLSLAAFDTETLDSIGVSAFEGCSDIKQIDLRRITSLGDDAFKGCTDLKTIKGSTVAFADDRYGCFVGDLSSSTPIETVLIGDRPTTFDAAEFERQTNRKIIDKYIDYKIEWTGDPVFINDDGTRIKPDSKYILLKIMVVDSTITNTQWETVNYTKLTVNDTDFCAGTSNEITVTYHHDASNSDLEYTCIIPTTSVEMENDFIYDNFVISGETSWDEGTPIEKENFNYSIDKIVTYNSGRVETFTIPVLASDVKIVYVTGAQVVYGDNNRFTIQYMDPLKQQKTAKYNLIGRCKHNNTYRTNVDAATCLEDGKYDLKCTQCNIITESNIVIPKLGHDWVQEGQDELGNNKYHCIREGCTAEYTDDDITDRTLNKITVDQTQVTVNDGDSLIKSAFTIVATYDITWKTGAVTQESGTVSSSEVSWKTNANSTLGDTFTPTAADTELTFMFGDKSVTIPLTVRQFVDTKYSISGTVIDYNYEPIKDYVVYMDNVQTVAKTDENGDFEFTDLSGGDHVLYFTDQESQDVSMTNMSYCTLLCKDGTVSYRSMDPIAAKFEFNAEEGSCSAMVNLAIVGKETSVSGFVTADSSYGAVGDRYIFLDDLSHYTKTLSNGYYSMTMTAGNHTLYFTGLKELPASTRSYGMRALGVSTYANSLGLDEDDIWGTVNFNVDVAGNVSVASEDSDYTVDTTDGTSLKANIVVPKTVVSGSSSSGGEDPVNPVDPVDPDAVYGAIRGYIKIPSKSWDPYGKLIFLDGTSKYCSISKTGFYSFGNLAEGNHVLYLTKYTSAEDVDMSKNLDEQSEIVAYVSVGSKGTTVFRSDTSAANDEKVTVSKNTDENTGVLTLSYTIGKSADTPAGEYNGEGIRVKGNLNSKNGLYANRMILLDTYDRWTVGDASGGFYFDYVTEGEHTLYITQNIKSAMLGTTGPVDPEEKCYIIVKFKLYYDYAERLSYTAVVESTDYTSCTYSWTEPAFDDQGTKVSSGVLSYNFVDNSSTPSTKSGITVNGTVQSDNFTVPSRVALLDNYDTWVVMNSSGEFTFEDVEDGEHTLYITKSKKSDLKFTTGEISPEEPILAKFSIKSKDNVIQSVKLISSDDTTSWQYTINEKMDTVKLSIKDVEAEVFDGVSISGSVSSENYTVSTRMVLLDSYDNWVVMSADGGFSFSNVMNGEHFLYITKSTKSNLKGSTGSVSSEEPLLAKFSIIVEDNQIKSVKLLSCDDTVSWSGDVSDKKDSAKLSIKDLKAAAKDGITIKGSISGQKDSYAGLTVLLDTYDNWVTNTTDGSWAFENVADGTHTIYVTKNKHSNLKKKTGTIHKDEPCFIKIRVVLSENAFKSTSIIEADDDVTMDYNFSNGVLQYTIDDNTPKSETSDKNTTNTTTSDKNTTNTTEEKKDIPVAFILAYVHDGRAAKGVYVFVDDLLTNYAVNSSGSMYCWIPEGDHTIYVTATDPGAVVVAGGDLETSPYLLWKGSVTNTSGKITSVTEMAAVKNSIHNIKVSPQLNSMALAMVTTTPLSTAVDLTGGKVGSGVVADSMTNTSSGNSSSSSSNGNSSTSDNSESSDGNVQETYSIVGDGSSDESSIVEGETYTIGETSSTIEKLPQTDIDYLMTVAADYGLVDVDKDANFYVNAKEALKIAKTLDTPEAIQLKKDIRNNNLPIIAMVVFAGLALVGTATIVIRKRKSVN